MNVKKVFRAMTLLVVILAASITLNAQTTKVSDGKTSDTKADQKVTTLVLSPEKISLEPGKTQKITVKSGLEKSDPAPKWSSSNEKVATVDKEGTVKAIAEGKAIITATVTPTTETNKAITASKKEGKCEVTVSRPNTADSDVALDVTDTKIEPGKTKKITVKSGGDVTWTSSDNSIATVDEKGNVTAKKEGKVTITATSKNNKNKKSKCEVVVGQDTTVGLMLDPKEKTLNPGQTQKITIKSGVAVTDKSKLTWTSSKTSVATVDKDGNVRAIAGGEATITVTEGNKKGTCKIIVNKTATDNTTK